MPEKIRREYIVGGALMVGTLAMLILASKKVEAMIPQEDIILSEFIIEPTEVYVNEPVIISVRVTNIGKIKGVYEVIHTVDEIVIRTPLSLNPNGSKLAVFTYHPDIAKTYRVNVDGLTGTFTAYGV